MAFKRALWTSGYTYRTTCPACGLPIEYTDRQLDFRPWYPNGFIYCMRCRKPLRHNEYFAVKPDGTPVYRSPAEAESAVRIGYYSSMGGPYANAPYNSAPYANPAYTNAPQTNVPVQGAGENPLCPNCGTPYVPGITHFCPNCGNKFD